MLNWVKSVPKTLFVLDAFMMVLFVVVMLPHVTGVPLHEWLSFVFLIPFVIHLVFHWDWLIRMPRQLFSAIRGEARFNIVWDTLLYLLMSFAIISGVLASEFALPTLGIPITPDPFWTHTHHQFSNLLFPLIGVHLAMHWKWIVTVAKSIFRKSVRTSEEGAI